MQLWSKKLSKYRLNSGDRRVEFNDRIQYGQNYRDSPRYHQNYRNVLEGKIPEGI